MIALFKQMPNNQPVVQVEVGKLSSSDPSLRSLLTETNLDQDYSIVTLQRWALRLSVSIC